MRVPLHHDSLSSTELPGGRVRQSHSGSLSVTSRSWTHWQNFGTLKPEHGPGPAPGSESRSQVPAASLSDSARPGDSESDSRFRVTEVKFSGGRRRRPLRQAPLTRSQPEPASHVSAAAAGAPAGPALYSVVDLTNFNSFKFKSSDSDHIVKLNQVTFQVPRLTTGTEPQSA